MSRRSVLSLVGLTAVLGSGCFGATLYDESTFGDLSNNGLSPTFVTFGPGSNVVRGTTGLGTIVDRDYFTFVVPQGLAVTSLVELANTTVGNAVSFIGIEQGNAVTVPTNAQTAAGLLGWTHYSAATTDTDLLPTMSISNLGSSGFNGSLGPGTYSVWIQDGNVGTFAYGFDFQLNTVPEPGTLGMVLGAVALVAFRSKMYRLRSSLIRRR
jgi:hypothetical protein